jgi:hypothetical protein
MLDYVLSSNVIGTGKTALSASAKRFINALLFTRFLAEAVMASDVSLFSLIGNYLVAFIDVPPAALTVKVTWPDDGPYCALPAKLTEKTCCPGVVSGPELKFIAWQPADPCAEVSCPTDAPSRERLAGKPLVQLPFEVTSKVTFIESPCAILIGRSINDIAVGIVVDFVCAPLALLAPLLALLAPPADAADAEVVVFVVVDAACDALLAAWLLLVDDVQPAIDNEAIVTNTIIVNNFFSIQVPLGRKMSQERTITPW